MTLNHVLLLERIDAVVKSAEDRNAAAADNLTAVVQRLADLVDRFERQNTILAGVRSSLAKPGEREVPLAIAEPVDPPSGRGKKGGAA